MFADVSQYTDKRLDFTPKGALEKILADPKTPTGLPTILNDTERAYYVQELGRGMHGPLNYYRITQYRHEEELG